MKSKKILAMYLQIGLRVLNQSILMDLRLSLESHIWSALLCCGAHLHCLKLGWMNPPPMYCCSLLHLNDSYLFIVHIIRQKWLKSSISPSRPEDAAEVQKGGRIRCRCSWSVLQSWSQVWRAFWRLRASLSITVTSRMLKPRGGNGMASHYFRDTRVCL